MDVVYHRNCLDGIFSAYLAYLFAKSLTTKIYDYFVQHLQSGGDNLLDTFIIKSENQLISYQSLNQQFFHKQCPQVHFNSVSMYAGQFFPIKASKKNNILLIVDISPTQKHTLIKLSQQFRHIIIFQHHTSFVRTQQLLKQLKLKNIHYVWQQSICAAQLLLSYLHKKFNFLQSNYPLQFIKQTYQKIDYVGKNDLKNHEDRQSKQFVLGFYYFQIQMSHLNPFLFKRLWSMSLQSILQKGKNLYDNHLEKLKFGIESCQAWKINRGKFKGKQFLGIQLKDRGITSDLGSILAYISANMGNQNLAMIFKKGVDYRISLRSSLKSKKQPLALQMARIYGGGGHVCAAGCCLTKTSFKQDFISLGHLKPKIKMINKEVQQILFQIQDQILQKQE